MFNFLKSNKKEVKEYLKDYRQTQSTNSLRDNQAMRMSMVPDFDSQSLIPRGPYADKPIKQPSQSMRYSQIIQKPQVQSPQSQYPPYQMYGYMPQPPYMYYPYGQQPPMQNDMISVKETKEDEEEEDVKPKVKKQNDKNQQVSHVAPKNTNLEPKEEQQEFDFDDLMAPFVEAVEEQTRRKQQKISIKNRIKFIRSRGIDTCTQLLDIQPQLESCCKKLRMDSCMETHNAIMDKLMKIQNNIQKFVLP